jgi:hypothetical protein
VECVIACRKPAQGIALLMGFQTNRADITAIIFTRELVTLVDNGVVNNSFHIRVAVAAKVTDNVALIFRRVAVAGYVHAARISCRKRSIGQIGV